MFSKPFSMENSTFDERAYNLYMKPFNIEAMSNNAFRYETVKTFSVNLKVANTKNKKKWHAPPSDYAR